MYSEAEFMICTAARMIEDKKTVFVGYGMPQIAMMLSQRLYAPNSAQVYEFGAVAPQVHPPFVRFAMADSGNNYRSVQWTTMNPIMAQASLGLIDYGFLGAAQIDPYGNINSTMIGEYERPKARFPGSGGGNEVASLCWKTIYILKHEKRRFVEKLDFMTSPGYLDGSPYARERAGLPRGTGPYRVITSKAIMGFDSETHRMKLLATAPDVSVQDVVENTGFELLIGDVEELEPPTEQELKILREEIDPGKYVI
ncbi:MAG: CoA-transferase subunit beta [Candidatus Methanofastidiosia archaeon]